MSVTTLKQQCCNSPYLINDRVKINASLLQSALKSPSVQRVVLTSSIVANLSEDTKGPTLASTRIPPPAPLPKTFSNVMEAYVVAKMVQLQDSDAFAEKHSPHFTISHVMPGYVFGRNELALDTTMMQTQNSSNNFLMVGLLGGELPFPIHGAFAHIDDVAEVHLRVALEEGPGRDVGVATKVNYDSILDAVESKYPEAVTAGLLKKGKISTLPVEYDYSDAEAMVGGLKSFESAVADVAAQYLALLKGEE